MNRCAICGKRFGELDIYTEHSFGRICGACILQHNIEVVHSDQLAINVDQSKQRISQVMEPHEEQLMLPLGEIAAELGKTHDALWSDVAA